MANTHTPTYDPLLRGAYPVGVRSVSFVDETSDRVLPTEVCYPAAASHAGADMDPARQDRFPLLEGGATVPQAAVRDAPAAGVSGAPVIVFSHGMAGHRRQSTFYTTHLASHGYMVLAPDHTGNTLADMAGVIAGGPEGIRAALEDSARDRRRDIPFLMDTFADVAPDLAAQTDPDRIGLSGHSFGGWTTVAVTSDDSRARCAVALAPPGTGEAHAIRVGDPYWDVDLAREGRVPTLILAAERDLLCPLPAIERLHAALGPGHDLLVLRDAAHFHFCDRALSIHQWYGGFLQNGGLGGLIQLTLAPVEELLEEAPAQDFVCGPALAHFDAHVRDNDDAKNWLRDSMCETLDTRGAHVLRV